MKKSETESQIIFTITTDMDSNNSKALKKVILADIDSVQKDVIIDLHGMKYIDSSGINVLIQIHKVQVQKKRRMIIRKPSEMVIKTISLGNLDKIFEFET